MDRPLRKTAALTHRITLGNAMRGKKGLGRGKNPLRRPGALRLATNYGNLSGKSTGDGFFPHETPAFTQLSWIQLVFEILNRFN